jgi:peptidyl-prolyl cis-trans isomerase SurA
VVAGVLCAAGASAQSVVAIVNDEPITAVDVAQRQRWISRTNGFGDRMKAALTSDSIKEKFRQMMIAANPRSQAEAQQVAERVKKQLLENTKARVLSEGASKKDALNAIIEDKLKLQAAKANGVKITDAEVEENLSLRASGGKSSKVNLTEFYATFENDGIGRKTIQSIVRSQLAWRDVMRKLYGPQIASVVQVSIPDKKDNDAEQVYELRVLRLPVASPADEGKRMLEAENLRQKFKSCKELNKEATLVSNATVKSLDKVKVDSLPKEVQPLVRSGSEGQMTPAVVVGGAVESYAICKKGAAATAKAGAKPAEEKPDARQVEYERFSKKYLQKLRTEAVIDMRNENL